MENPILDFTDTPAKRWREHNAGAIAAARARGLWPVFERDERVKSAPVSAAPQPAPVPRRQRKRSLTTILRQARKAGADRVEYGEAVIHLTGNGSPAAPVEAESDVNEWEGEPA